MATEVYGKLASAIGAARGGAVDGFVRLAYAAHAAGELSDNEAQALAELAAERRKPEAAKPRQASLFGSALARAGSKPRRPQHVGRRRQWAASGWLPGPLAALFTAGHQAVLSVIASEVKRNGRCELCNAAIAERAGVGDSTVKAAKRRAVLLGLLEVELRRVTAWRNDTNVVRVVSREWRAWIATRAGGGGVKSPTPYDYGSEKRRSETRQTGAQEGCRGREGGRAVEPEPWRRARR